MWGLLRSPLYKTNDRDYEYAFTPLLQRTSLVKVGSMFCINCEQLNIELIKRARLLKAKLLGKMQSDSLSLSSSLLAKFVDIEVKATTVPTDTEHLMNLKAAVIEFETNIMPKLGDQVLVLSCLSCTHVTSLSGYVDPVFSVTILNSITHLNMNGSG